MIEKRKHDSYPPEIMECMLTGRCKRASQAARLESSAHGSCARQQQVLEVAPAPQAASQWYARAFSDSMTDAPSLYTQNVMVHFLQVKCLTADELQAKCKRIQAHYALWEELADRASD